MFRPIVSVVIAALLMTGAMLGQPVSELGADTTKNVKNEISVRAVALEDTGVQQTKDQIQWVTRQQAIDAALAHAGLNAAEVTELKAELDVERTGDHWDVDFRAGDWEYDYEVDAVTGAVTKHEKEYDPEKKPTEPKPTEQKTAEPKATEPKPTEAPAAEKLTRQQAIDAALTRAGLTEGEVTRLIAEYDVERTGDHWDVDFRSGDWEYDYEVDAVTGAVTKHEKEYDPEKKPTEPKATEPKATEPKPTEAPAVEKLTRQQAIDAALLHAGLTEAEVTRLTAEYDVERTGDHWDVDFRSGDWEYDYEVDAVTGEVTKHEKEYDPEKKPTEPAATEPKATEPKPTEAPAAEKLTRQQAIDAALTHAGLTEGEVTRLEAEYDFDDGVYVWEVEFRVGRDEYSYELLASDGKILSWEKEYDD